VAAGIIDGLGRDRRPSFLTKFGIEINPASALQLTMEAQLYKRLTLDEIQRLRGLNTITTRDLVAHSRQAIQASWAVLAKAQRILDGNDRQREQRIADEIAAELVDLTRQSARLRDDGAMLAMIAGPLSHH
jgi:hypothetical protein